MILSVRSLPRPHIRRRRGGDTLVQRGLMLRLQGALECRALFQPLVVMAHGIGKLRGQAQVISQHEGVVHRHIGRGEAAGAEEFLLLLLQGGIHRFQPGEEPAAVVLRDLGLFAVLGLEVGVAQHQGLREGERGFAHVQPVQVGAMGRVCRRHIQLAGTVPCREVLAYRGGFGHAGVAIHQQGYGAQGVVGQEFAGQRAWRKGQHAQRVGQAQLLEHPQRPEGAGADAVVKGDHAQSLGCPVSQVLPRRGQIRPAAACCLAGTPPVTGRSTP